MLHRQALPTGTLDLLIELSGETSEAGFALAGGTSLALRFGHRISVDLDFFTPDPFDSLALSQKIGTGRAIAVMRMVENSLSAVVDGVKTDFITYRYPLLHSPETIEGVRLLSLEDVVAMKLAAMTNRGAKKDFYDVHHLISLWGLPRLLDAYQRKFPTHDPLIVLRSLSYFEDAELEPDPESLTGLTWNDIKRGIRAEIRTLL